MTRRLIAAVALATLLHGAAARADPSADADEARRLFLEGRELFVQHRCEQALPKLLRSNQILPSPNSALIAARCLRELGRVEEAVERFEAVGADAQARVAAGDAKYQETADAARSEGAALRAVLGVLRVRVTGAPAGTLVETDTSRRPVGVDGVAEILHRPGSVRFAVRAPSRPPLERTATLSAGKWTTVEVLVPTAEPTPSAVTRPGRPDAPYAPDARPTWMVPTGAVLAGVGVVGLGAFAVLGSMSQSTFDRLESECGSAGCDPNDARLRGDADSAETQQTFANVALAAGSVALAGGVVLIVVGASQDDPPVRAGLAIGPRGVMARGAF